MNNRNSPASAEHMEFLTLVQRNGILEHEAARFVDWASVFATLEDARDATREHLEKTDRGYPYEMRDGVPRSLRHYREYMTITVGGTRGTALRLWMNYRFNRDTLFIHGNEESDMRMFYSNLKLVGKRAGGQTAPRNIELEEMFKLVDDFVMRRPQKLEELLKGVRNVVIDRYSDLTETTSPRQLYSALINCAEQELNFYLVN